jgi:hypothetical protein
MCVGNRFSNRSVLEMSSRKDEDKSPVTGTSCAREAAPRMQEEDENSESSDDEEKIPKKRTLKKDQQMERCLALTQGEGAVNYEEEIKHSIYQAAEVGEGGHTLPPSGAGGVSSILATSDAQNVHSFRRWRFEMKLSPFHESAA